MGEATFFSGFGWKDVKFVVEALKASWFEFGPVPAEWQKVHDFIVESRRLLDSDDLDRAVYIVKKLSEGKYRFSAEFNNSGHWDHGLLTTRPDGSLKLEYHYSFV